MMSNALVDCSKNLSFSEEVSPNSFLPPLSADFNIESKGVIKEVFPKPPTPPAAPAHQNAGCNCPTCANAVKREAVLQPVVDDIVRRIEDVAMRYGVEERRRREIEAHMKKRQDIEAKRRAEVLRNSVPAPRVQPQPSFQQQPPRPAQGPPVVDETEVLVVPPKP